MSSEKIIVLYERLSREDENLGESYSISNQKKLLEDYCREKGWTRFRHFTDDGISGTTFERPSFKAMMELVEDGVKRENEKGDCGGWGGVVEWVVESKFETGGYGTC